LLTGDRPAKLTTSIARGATARENSVGKVITFKYKRYVFIQYKNIIKEMSVNWWREQGNVPYWTAMQWMKTSVKVLTYLWSVKLLVLNSRARM
jgi:hypothetical protein